MPSSSARLPAAPIRKLLLPKNKAFPFLRRSRRQILRQGQLRRLRRHLGQDFFFGASYIHPRRSVLESDLHVRRHFPFARIVGKTDRCQLERLRRRRIQGFRQPTPPPNSFITSQLTSCSPPSLGQRIHVQRRMITLALFKKLLSSLPNKGFVTACADNPGTLKVSITSIKARLFGMESFQVISQIVAAFKIQMIIQRKNMQTKLSITPTMKWFNRNMASISKSIVEKIPGKSIHQCFALIGAGNIAG